MATRGLGILGGGAWPPPPKYASDGASRSHSATAELLVAYGEF